MHCTVRDDACIMLNNSTSSILSMANSCFDEYRQNFPPKSAKYFSHFPHERDHWAALISNPFMNEWDWKIRLSTKRHYPPSQRKNEQTKLSIRHSLPPPPQGGHRISATKFRQIVQRNSYRVCTKATFNLGEIRNHRKDDVFR